MLQFEFLPDRVIVILTKSSRESGKIETSELSNGEFGWLLRVASHPNAQCILNGEIDSTEVGMSRKQLQLLGSKIRVSHFGGAEIPWENPQKPSSFFGGDPREPPHAESITETEIDAALSLKIQGKSVGPETIALMFECDPERSRLLIDEVNKRCRTPVTDEGSLQTPAMEA